jgi:hypothetical protein
VQRPGVGSPPATTDPSEGARAADRCRAGSSSAMALSRGGREGPEHGSSASASGGICTPGVFLFWFWRGRPWHYIPPPGANNTSAFTRTGDPGVGDARPPRSSIAWGFEGAGLAFCPFLLRTQRHRCTRDNRGQRGPACIPDLDRRSPARTPHPTRRTCNARRYREGCRTIGSLSPLI